MNTLVSPYIFDASALALFRYNLASVRLVRLPLHDDLPIGAVDDNRGSSLRHSVGDGGIGPALVAAAEHVIAYGTTVHLDGRPAEQGAFDQSLIECSLPEALSAAEDAARHRAVAYYDRGGTRVGNGQ